VLEREKVHAQTITGVTSKKLIWNGTQCRVRRKTNKKRNAHHIGPENTEISIGLPPGSKNWTGNEGGHDGQRDHKGEGPRPYDNFPMGPRHDGA